MWQEVLLDSPALATEGPWIGWVSPTLKHSLVALAGVTQWTECRPANQRVAGPIPSQGTGLGCGPGPQLEACERQLINVSLTYQCFSPSLSPPSPLSLK